MYVLGLDPSPLRLGWAYLTLKGEPVRCGMEKLKSPEITFEVMVRLALSNFDRLHIEFAQVWIEEMFVGINPKASLDLEYSAGQVAQAASRRWPEARIRRVPPPVWKREVGLKGNAKKGEVMARAKELGWNPPIQDAADAAMIAWAGYLIDKKESP